MIIHIIKRRGHKEPFDERKVYASVSAAARNCHLDERTAEKIAETVLVGLREWLADKSQIPSVHIFEKVIELLNKENGEVAFMYHTHRDVS